MTFDESSMRPAVLTRRFSPRVQLEIVWCQRHATALCLCTFAYMASGHRVHELPWEPWPVAIKTVFSFLRGDARIVATIWGSTETGETMLGVVGGLS